MTSVRYKKKQNWSKKVCSLGIEEVVSPSIYSFRSAPLAHANNLPDCIKLGYTVRK